MGPQGVTVAMHNGLLVYFGNAARPHAKWLSLARVLADPELRGRLLRGCSPARAPGRGLCGRGRPRNEHNRGHARKRIRPHDRGRTRGRPDGGGRPSLRGSGRSADRFRGSVRRRRSPTESAASQAAQGATARRAPPPAPRARRRRRRKLGHGSDARRLRYRLRALARPRLRRSRDPGSARSRDPGSARSRLPAPGADCYSTST